MRNLLALIVLFITSTSFSQTYSYHFTGSIDQTKLATLEQELLDTKLFEAVKLKVKESNGEVWFKLIPSVKKTEEEMNYASIVKAALIKNELNPTDLIEIEL